MARVSLSHRTLPPLVAAACLLAGAATAADWRPVPGAADLEIDVTSLQQERTRVTAWLRWWGRPALVPELAAWSARAPRVQRTALRTEFDCGQRSLRTLAAHAYDGEGKALFMSSVPGPAQPVQGAELEWAYDAVCEAARGAGRH